MGKIGNPETPSSNKNTGKMTRREFLRKISSSAAALALGENLLSSCAPNLLAELEKNTKWEQNVQEIIKQNQEKLQNGEIKTLQDLDELFQAIRQAIYVEDKDKQREINILDLLFLKYKEEFLKKVEDLKNLLKIIKRFKNINLFASIIKRLNLDKDDPDFDKNFDDLIDEQFEEFIQQITQDFYRILQKIFIHSGAIFDFQTLKTLLKSLDRRGFGTQDIERIILDRRYRNYKETLLHELRREIIEQDSVKRTLYSLSVYIIVNKLLPGYTEDIFGKMFTAYITQRSCLEACSNRDFVSKKDRYDGKEIIYLTIPYQDLTSFIYFVLTNRRIHLNNKFYIINNNIDPETLENLKTASNPEYYQREIAYQGRWEIAQEFYEKLFQKIGFFKYMEKLDPIIGATLEPIEFYRYFSLLCTAMEAEDLQIPPNKHILHT